VTSNLPIPTKAMLLVNDTTIGIPTTEVDMNTVTLEPTIAAVMKAAREKIVMTIIEVKVNLIAVSSSFKLLNLFQRRSQINYLLSRHSAKRMLIAILVLLHLLRI